MIQKNPGQKNNILPHSLQQARCHIFSPHGPKALLRNHFRPIIRPSNGSGLHPGKPTPNNADGLVIFHLFKKCLLIHMGMQPPSLDCLLGRREDKTRLKVQSAIFNRHYPVLNLDRILAPLRFGLCCPGT